MTREQMKNPEGRDSAIGLLEKWVELAERTMKDHPYALHANRMADFRQAVRETKEFLKNA